MNILFCKHFLTHKKSVVINDSPPPLKGFVLCFFGIQESTKSKWVRKNDHPLKVDVSVINIDYYVYPPEIEVCKYLEINKLQRQPKRTCRQNWYSKRLLMPTKLILMPTRKVQCRRLMYNWTCRQKWYFHADKFNTQIAQEESLLCFHFRDFIL